MKEDNKDESVEFARTGGSSRPGIAPSSRVPTPPLLSSPPPAPGSASAQSRPPPLPQRGAGGLYPGRGRTAGSPPSAQAEIKRNKRGVKM